MPPFVSTSALIVDGDRVLVVVDPVRQEPVLPGGHLKWTETPLDAVVREVREETGYVIQAERLLDVLAGKAATGEPGVVRILFEATIRGGSLQSSSEGEARWLPVDHVARLDARDSPILRSWLSQRTSAPL